MEDCQTYKDLAVIDQHHIWELIKKRIIRKSNVAYTHIEDSDLPEYLLKVTVAKYNTVRGWATIGYFRQHKGGWKLSFNPKRKDRRTRPAGRTGSYF